MFLNSNSIHEAFQCLAQVQDRCPIIRCRFRGDSCVAGAQAGEYLDAVRGAPGPGGLKPVKPSDFHARSDTLRLSTRLPRLPAERLERVQESAVCRFYLRHFRVDAPPGVLSKQTSTKTVPFCAVGAMRSTRPNASSLPVSIRASIPTRTS